MNKDIIYIDVEDDITAIIGKIKASKDKVVALVPPKRIGVLQSAVNLKLLARIANTSHKHLVLITNNQALIALSVVAKIPIAKNLQSKPEIAEIAALEIDEGEDVIDGAQLPVSELIKTTDSGKVDEVSEVIGTINIDNEESQLSDNTSKLSQIKKSSPKSGISVPDFSRFRKKLFIGISIVPLLIGFIIWAIWFAPSAKVIITAKTTQVDISQALKLGGTDATDISKNLVQTVTKQIKKDVSVDFTATGTRDESVQASGVVTLSIKCSDVGSSPTIIPAGNEIISSGGKIFIAQNDISVTNAAYDGGCHFTGSGDVLAQLTGESYNLQSGASYTVDGYSTVTGIGSAMTGGLTKIATIVTAADIQKASQQLVDLSTDAVKKQLIGQYANGELVISESFSVDRAAAVSVPALGLEAADGKAKLTSSTTFSITAIAKSELELLLKDKINKQIADSKNQRIYDDGIESVVLKDYNDTAKTVNISTIGQIGPNIDTSSVKEQVKGMQYGDIQALLEAIDGVDDVDIKFSYFWVNTVPNDSNKIEVEFVLQNV